MLRRFARSGVSALEIRPETGRTHQIRVHLASSGMPIVGDPIYGKGADTFGLAWPALHAAVLGFVHPRSGTRLRFESALPPELLALVERLVAREVPA
jgi:23S rRNA pseudouridine1911/1915/1917 synthase